MTNRGSEPSAENERKSKLSGWISTTCMLLGIGVFAAFWVHVYQTNVNWPHRTSSPFNFVIDNYGWHYFWAIVTVCVGYFYFAHLQEYFRRVTIPVGVPLTVSETGDGLPSIVWEAKEADRKAFYEGDIQFTYNDTVRVRWNAFLNRDGVLIVTARNCFRMREHDSKDHKDGYLPLGDAPLKTIVKVPIDDVVGFSKRDSAHVDLGGVDLNRFQQGRLLYMQHNIAVVELRDKSTLLFGRSCYSAQATDDLLVALTQQFIMKRPPDGWAAMLKKKNDVANPTSAVATASATHDPI